MPRNKKYDWSDKKDACYKLYVEEQRSMREILAYFSEALGVPEENLPSYVNCHRRRQSALESQDGVNQREQDLLTVTQQAVVLSPVSGMEISWSLGENSSRGGGQDRRAHQAAVGTESWQC